MSLVGAVLQPAFPGDGLYKRLRFALTQGSLDLIRFHALRMSLYHVDSYGLGQSQFGLRRKLKQAMNERHCRRCRQSLAFLILPDHHLILTERIARERNLG